MSVTTPEDSILPSVCPLCGKSFPNKNIMIVHYQSHRQLRDIR
jgi:uncharacterized Zn-finger protein